MDLIHTLLNLIVPLILLISLLLFLPFYLIYKLLFTIFRSLSIENISGKVVLITGASSGMGEHLAYEYARQGACLVLVARRENLLLQVSKKARELGSPDVITSCADVSKIDDCKRFVEEAINHFGRLDHLINNAGITGAFTFEETTNILSCKSLMDVNFWGSIYPTHFAIPHLKKSKGKIIVNSSVAGYFLSPTNSIYGATKAALISFYDTLRVELDPRITITMVCPGFIDSEMTRGKHLSNEGVIEVNQTKTEAIIGAFPIRSVEESAKAIVKGVCRGDKYITDPSYFRALFMWKVFCPDVVHYLGRMFVVNETTSKRLVDPSSARSSSEIKSD